MADVQKKFNPEEFRVKFRATFAIISFLVGMAFISLACFSETAAKSEHIGTIIGFICGTMITLILTYYFGSSDTQDNSVPGKPPEIIDESEKEEIDAL